MIYDEDWQWLDQNFGPGSHGAAAGISGAIRHILHQRVQGMKAQANGELDRMQSIQAQEAKGATGIEGGGA